MPQLKIAITDTLALKVQTQFLRNAVATGLSAAVFAGAFEIMNEAKLLAPVRTGLLRQSIHTEMIEETHLTATAAIAPATDYAGYVEFGTSRMAAQPYMRPAFENKRERAAQIISEQIGAEIRDAVINAGGGRKFA